MVALLQDAFAREGPVDLAVGLGTNLLFERVRLIGGQYRWEENRPDLSLQLEWPRPLGLGANLRVTGLARRAHDRSFSRPDPDTRPGNLSAAASYRPFLVPPEGSLIERSVLAARVSWGRGGAGCRSTRCSRRAVAPRWSCP